MSTQKTFSQNFKVQVQVTYHENESQPQLGYHFFSYKIIISNEGSIPAQLLSRHWIITDAFGQIEEVKGAGVVGMQPKIGPGKSFEYESGCPLATSSGSMKGSYQLVADDGSTFEVEIPEFYLISPTALH
jgi:ApaG protein